MSTRSYIGYIEKGSSEVNFAYCHYDGYISNNGVILNECYNTFDKVKELVDNGNLSSLSTNIKGCNYYGNEPVNKCSLDEFKYTDEGEVDYYYLFDEDKGAWTVENKFGKEYLDAVLHDYEAYKEVGGSYDDFRCIQENIEEVGNLYQSWQTGPLKNVSSIYVPDKNAVEFHFQNDITYNSMHLNIPCEDKEDARRISENIVGKSINEIVDEYNLESDYREFTITSEDAIFDILKKALMEQRYYIKPEDEVTFVGSSYLGGLKVDYEQNGGIGRLNTEGFEDTINDYLNGDYKEQSAPSYDDEER